MKTSNLRYLSTDHFSKKIGKLKCHLSGWLSKNENAPFFMLDATLKIVILLLRLILILCSIENYNKVTHFRRPMIWRSHEYKFANLELRLLSLSYLTKHVYTRNLSHWWTEWNKNASSIMFGWCIENNHPAPCSCSRSPSAGELRQCHTFQKTSDPDVSRIHDCEKYTWK